MKPESSPPNRRAARRNFLKLGVTLSGALAGCNPAKTPEAKTEDEPNRLGKPMSQYGERSPFEKASRSTPPKTPESGSTRTPLADCYGTITPPSLHFERHHSGVPTIDPAQHRLMIHGLVSRPLILTVDEIRRLPSITQVHFVECSGNGSSEWGEKTAATAQASHGLASCSEWTGVSLALLLAEAGIQPEAKWLLADGADACHMQRSVPIHKALDDAMIAYAQNGEAIRPEQGYPMRLLLPGFEGNTNVKWLRRIKATAEPTYTRDETSKYTDLLADGKARMFTFELEAKSVITHPSGGQKMGKPGPFEIRGLAWSGRGRIDKVEVSTDGGKSWHAAQLQEPRMPKAFTLFRLPWTWDGGEVTVLSRCTDQTGYVQPTRDELVAARGLNSNYHNNSIKAWKVAADGSVTNA